MTKKIKEYIRTPCKTKLLHCVCNKTPTTQINLGIIRIFPDSISSFKKWPSPAIKLPRTNQDCLYNELIKFGTIYYISPAKKGSPLTEIKPLIVGELTSHIVIADKVFYAIQMYINSDYQQHMTLYKFLTKVL